MKNKRIDKFNYKMRDVLQELKKIDNPEKRFVIKLTHETMLNMSQFLEKNQMTYSEYVNLCSNLLSNLSANLLLIPIKNVKEKFHQEAIETTLDEIRYRSEKSLIFALEQWMTEKGE